MRSTDRAPLIEIFSSIQGEGSFAGVPMVFVRTAVCPIRCRYCDTPESHRAPARFAVRAPDCERDEANPVAAGRAADLAAAVAEPGAGVRHLSITGGEPLLHPGFVRALAHALRARGYAVHLETAALDPRALGEVIGAIDHLSADYKLPSTLERGDHREQHRACLALGVEAGITVDAKVVVTAEVGEDEIAAALDHLAGLRDGMVLILQPVTPFGAVREAPPADRMARLAAMACARGFAARVLPQVHKVLAVR